MPSADGFSSTDKAKGGDLLRLAVIEDLKIFRLEVVDVMAFLVANHYVL